MNTWLLIHLTNTRGAASLMQMSCLYISHGDWLPSAVNVGRLFSRPIKLFIMANRSLNTTKGPLTSWMTRSSAKWPRRTNDKRQKQSIESIDHNRSPQKLFGSERDSIGLYFWFPIFWTICLVCSAKEQPADFIWQGGMNGALLLTSLCHTPGLNQIWMKWGAPPLCMQISIWKYCYIFST